MTETPIDLKQVRERLETANAGASPEEARAQETRLILSVFELWPQLVEGLCETVNEHFKQHIVIAQALDPSTPLRVKAVRADTLRAAIEEQGVEAILDVLERIDANMKEIHRRARALRAERDRLAQEAAARGTPE